MKNLIKIFSVYVTLIFVLGSCDDDFLLEEPKGAVSNAILRNEEGVNTLLIGAYALLDGHADEPGQLGQSGEASGHNWIWGDVASDDMYRGDQTGGWGGINEIERYEAGAVNTWVHGAWRRYYDAVSRANDALRVLAEAKSEGNIEDAVANQLEAEARFLRAWFHFQLRIKFEKVPYITEDVDPVTVSNDVEIWDLIEEDIQWGIDNGMDESPDLGRASRWAAKAFKARVHLFQEEWESARILLDDIIDNGGFVLEDHFYNNHDEEFQNNGEAIFEIQYSVNDGGDKFNSGYDHQVLFPRQTGNCCDYSGPSFDLFNAFKVDANGLPFLDTFQDDLLLEDFLVEFDADFTPTTELLDPRVDWTIGRRGVMFLDWGPYTGNNWPLDPIGMGPFLNKKIMFWERNASWIQTTAAHWAGGLNGDNFSLFRLGHILLWRAEVAVELNDLPRALNLVNQIRLRASDDIFMGRINNTNFAPGYVLDIDMTQPAANYLLGQYPPFTDATQAMKAVRHEMRLEFALEGMRFFDLVRWGIDSETLNGYLESEDGLRPWMVGATYVDGKNDHWPVPQVELDLSNGVLTQDPAY
ncbi:MAG: RagB/SusD family nutrient uptake outer membrane protein [Reichenbachiella sp.]